MQWIFTAQSLYDSREESNREANKRIKDSFIEEQKLNSSVKIPVDFITVKEQLLLLQFYESKIKDYCKFFKFNSTVKATAIVLFKRYYLRNSICEKDPKIVLITCLFISTKIEHTPINLPEFMSKIPKAPDVQMIELELELSIELNFEFNITHPYFALHGFFLDLQSVVGREKVQKLYLFYQNAIVRIDDLFESDCMLLHSASQIALSCLYYSFDDAFRNILISYLNKFQGYDVKELIKTIKTIADIEIVVIDKEEAKRIAQTVDASFSREFSAGSALY